MTGGEQAALPPPVQRTLDFVADLARRCATSVEPAAGGFTVRNHRFPYAYDRNQLIVIRPVAAAELLADADRQLAGLRHRRIWVLDDALGLAVAPHLIAAGYAHERDVVMAARAGMALPDPSVPVTAVSYGDIADAVAANWRRDRPGMPEEAIRQLVARRAATAAACELTHLAVTDGGQVAAWADLYRDGGIAQVETVHTVPEWRGRGFAKALVLEATRRARVAGADLVFLLADLDDWPWRFYERAGFGEIARTHGFVRT